MKKEVPLSLRIYADSAYTDLVRSIGWLGKTYPIPKEEFDCLNAKHGKEKLIKAADDLLEYDTEKKLAKLKDSVRKHCWQLLGPPPETWDEFYADVEKPPPNPYKPADPQKEPRRWVAPPEMSTEQMIQKLSDAQLDELLKEARWAIGHYGEKSRKSRAFKKDVKMAEAEIARRKSLTDEGPSIDDVAQALANTIEAETGMICLVAHPDEIERLQQATTHRLKELLDMAEYEVGRYAPATVTHQEAVRAIALILTELNRRKSPAA